MLTAITRLEEKASEDGNVCEKYGHTCRIVSPLRTEICSQNIEDFISAANRGEFDCIFYTSALPAKLTAPRLKELKNTRIVAIGPQTQREIMACGHECEILPSFYSKCFIEYLGESVSGKKIGIPRADVPNPELIEGIRNKGGIVSEYKIYKLIPTGESLNLDGCGAVIFTSAGSFSHAVWDRKLKIIKAAIGEITAERMRKEGVIPDVTGNGSLEGTLAALNEYIALKNAHKSAPKADAEGDEAENTAGNTAENGISGDPELKKLLECGLISIDKPQGPTSHQVTAWVKEIFGGAVTQIGHGGTLDPQVSGALVIMTGRAVRLAPVILSSRKEYVAVLKLHLCGKTITKDEICAAFEKLTGRIYQRPPRRSAVRRQLRIRTIYALELLDYSESEGLVLFRTECEAGTYIRSLCIHIAYMLGVSGQMTELRRTRTGAVTLLDTCTLQELKDAYFAALPENGGRTEEIKRLIMPAEKLAEELPRIVIKDSAVEAVISGAKLSATGVISCTGHKRGVLAAVMTQKGELCAVAKTIFSSEEFRPGDNGLVAESIAVVMKPGTYRRGWTKHPKPDERKQKILKNPEKPAHFKENSKEFSKDKSNKNSKKISKEFTKENTKENTTEFSKEIPKQHPDNDRNSGGRHVIRRPERADDRRGRDNNSERNAKRLHDAGRGRGTEKEHPDRRGFSEKDANGRNHFTSGSRSMHSDRRRDGQNSSFAQKSRPRADNRRK